ncbi:MAG: ArsC/Spx/MgsR family protein [Sideroxyarcus sp.]|nr:ArsC/Spx/MgsR family protein [Sideroxyarcus sp.]
MATVIFFEKPGCGNNTRQKLWLAASGHTVLAKDLLKEKWRKDELRPFFGELPVVQWFNPSAPRIKSGKVNPVALDAETALAMMVAEPLLIRRPLMKTGDTYHAGFDADAVHVWIGLNDTKPKGSLEACTSSHAHALCPAPEATAK